MDWRKEAIKDLTLYYSRKRSLDHIPERICAIKEQLGALKSSATDRKPVQGGASRMEDNLINNIVLRDRLRHTYNANKILVGLTEKGLAGLDDRQRLMLERFYMQRHQGHVERLMEDLYLERSRVYQIKEDALYQFTIAMYGMIDY